MKNEKQSPRESIPLTVYPSHLIRHVDKWLMSYNIEMTEVTGGTFWKSYTREQIAGTAEFPSATSFTDVTAMPELMEYYPPIDLYNKRLRELAKALGPAWIRVSGTWATKTYYDFEGVTGGKAPEGYSNVLTKEQWIGVLDFVAYIGTKLLISVSNCVGDHPHGGPLDLTQAKKIFDFSHQHGKDIDAVEFMVVLFLFYEIDMLLRMFVSISVRLWRKGACHIQAIILCLTALGSFATLFIAAKLIGHKQIAQLDFFDYITGITIGSIAAEMATDLEEPWKPFTAILIYALVTLLLSVVTNKFPRTRRYLYGSPTILMDQGKLYRKNLKKAKLDLEEFLIMCRQQGYFDLTSIQTAIFEFNGRLTLLPVSTQRPVTPNDMNLSPEQELLFTELIMDGRILESNLQRMGLNLTWLDKQLKQRGIHSAQDVFLAVCDRNRKLVIYGNDHNETCTASRTK